MIEERDNTKPALSGSYSLSKMGLLSYFPVQDSGYQADNGMLRPFIALVLHEDPEGGLTASLDIRMDPIRYD